MNEIKRGDRVRIVIETTVRSDWRDGEVCTEWGDWYQVDEDGVVSIEKLAPRLPTAPGSVIRDKGTNTYRILNKAGWWVSGRARRLPVDLMNEFEVIYDAGMK